MANKLVVKGNERGQFQIKMTTTEGTINCVVSVPMQPPSPMVLRRGTALSLAKTLAKKLDAEIKDSAIIAPAMMSSLAGHSAG